MITPRFRRLVAAIPLAAALISAAIVLNEYARKDRLAAEIASVRREFQALRDRLPPQEAQEPAVDAHDHAGHDHSHASE